MHECSPSRILWHVSTSPPFRFSLDWFIAMFNQSIRLLHGWTFSVLCLSSSICYIYITYISQFLVSAVFLSLFLNQAQDGWTEGIQRGAFHRTLQFLHSATGLNGEGTSSLLSESQPPEFVNFGGEQAKHVMHIIIRTWPTIQNASTKLSKIEFDGNCEMQTGGSKCMVHAIHEETCCILLQVSWKAEFIKRSWRFKIHARILPTRGHKSAASGTGPVSHPLLVSVASVVVSELVSQIVL